MDGYIQRMWLREAEKFTEYEDEEWKVIPNAPGYVISTYGRIYSYRSHRTMHPSLTPDGYLQVGLRIDGKTYGFGVHNLVARAFIGPPYDEEEANHKDGIHDNNHISNIEWLTGTENNNYTKNVLRRPQKWKEELEKRRKRE